MGEGSDDAMRTPPDKARPDGQKELDELSARVVALERQVAMLSAALAGEQRTAESGQPGGAEVPVVHGIGHVAAPPPPRPEPPSFLVATPPAESKSLENQLGSQIFSRVGIVALLIGATWFLKLAIDNQWIGPVGRVLTGLLAGAGLVVWSERFRRQGYGAFSYSLKAVGSGVLYLTLWAAFQIYHLLPAEAALAAMLLVTAWNAYMAWAQNAELLAAYALIGGCATPALLSTGGNHENFLFLYLLAIDVATVALVRLRRWPRLLLGVFPVTVAYFIDWYMQFYRAEELVVTAIYIALFFVTFASSALRLVDPARETDAAGASLSVITEILLPLANAAFAGLASYSVLQDSGNHGALPWMVLLLAGIYLGVMKLPQSSAASAVHLSLAIVFLTIAIPLKASGRWITVSWLVEGAVLMWVAARLEAAGPVQDDSPTGAHRVLRALAIGGLLLGLTALLGGMYEYSYISSPAFFNHRFATALTGVAAFAFTAWIALRARRLDPSLPDRSEPSLRRNNSKELWLQIAGASIVVMNLVAVLAIVRELSALWIHTAENSEGDLQQALAISAFLMFYGAALLAIGFWKRTGFIRWQALLLIVYTIGKTFLYDMRSLSQGYRVASFMALGALLLAVSFAYQNDWLALRNKDETGEPEADALQAHAPIPGASQTGEPQ